MSKMFERLKFLYSYAKILNACLEPCNAYWLCIKAKIGYNDYKKYMPVLERCGLISVKAVDGRNTKIHVTTKKGREFLHRINQALKLLEDEQ